MEKEAFFSGYCRTQDESRMVCAVCEDGKLTDVDCSYQVCPYTQSCTIAQKILEFIQA